MKRATWGPPRHGSQGKVEQCFDMCSCEKKGKTDNRTLHVTRGKKKWMRSNAGVVRVFSHRCYRKKKNWWL